MNDILTYLFWPNPGNAGYDSPKVLAVLIACALLVAASFVLSYWRKRYANVALRKVSGLWSSAVFWFGLTGLFLVIARVEQIQFLAMRFLWVIWAVLAVIVIVFFVRMYKNRYYEVLPTITVADPRSKYLPRKKKR